MKHTQWRGSPENPLPMIPTNQPGHSLHPRATTRRLFNLALGTTCTRHDKRAGEACWSWPGTGVGTTTALCGKRIALTLQPRRSR